MNTLPRIYIVIATFLPLVGGAERQAFIQGLGLHKRGFETKIITFHHDKSWASNENLEGVPVIRVAGKILGNRENLPRLLQKFCYLLALITIGWTLWRHRHNYDILHIYMLNLLALPALIVSLLTNKPIIFGVRSAEASSEKLSRNKPSQLGDLLDSATAWRQVYQSNRQGGDLSALEQMGKSTMKFTSYLLRKVDAVVVILSTCMKEYLISYGFRDLDIQLIPNGVDCNRFHPPSTSPSSPERSHIVICVSKFRFQKGLDILLQAWYLVQMQYPQTRLILVGDGPLRSELEQMAEILGITNSILFAGLQSDIPSQLHRAGLFVLPSYWEGMPNALLEAMACGLPCVATRVSGSEDLIQPGVNGLLIEPGDHQTLAQALLKLLNEPKLMDEYGHEARIRIEQNYEVNKVIEAYISLYYTLIDRNRMESKKLTEWKTILHLCFDVLERRYK